MTREADRIGPLREELRHRAVILTPCPGSVAGILEVRMLDVEEGTFLAQLICVLAQEIAQTGYVTRMPVGPDEVVTLHRLQPDGTVVLTEAGLPHLCRPQSDALCLARLGIHAAPGIAIHIVVAIHKEFLYVLATG